MLIPTPKKITYNKQKDNTTEVVIEPCYPGYGTTIGNALRRVLLSSLPGSSVTAVKIDGIQHEYDTLDGVTEDVVEIMMNLKKLRVVCHSDEPVVLELTGKGEKELTAGDIKKNSDVDIINGDLVIATMTDKKADVRMEITVAQGSGYEPVEDRVVENKEIGVMQIDSLFSPITNVGFTLERTRVGQRTDYEKVVLSITTDGSIDAEDAVRQSVQILQDQFGAIVGAHDAEEVVEEEVEETPEESTEEEKEDK